MKREEMATMELEERRREEAVKLASFGFSSFRSEDSEVLALWEEKSECKCSPKAVSTDLSWLKPRLSVDSSLSPWRESFGNAVRKIESLSHVFSRSSPVYPKDNAGESPARPSLEYLMKHEGRRSSWRDFRIASSPARSSTESGASVLHNSPKARYNNAKLCRVMRRTDHELMLEGSAPSQPNKLRHAVSCETERQSVAVDSDHRWPKVEAAPRSDGSHGKTRGEVRNVVNTPQLSCTESRTQPERCVNSEEAAKSGHDAGKPPTLPCRTYSLNLPKPDGTSSSRRSSAVAPNERRQSTKVSASSSMERCSSTNRTRSQSMDEAMLNECASEGGVQQARQEAGTHEPVSRKPSHRYYQKVTSRERSSSRWSSGDDTPLDQIDFVAPSAVRFLEEDETSPMKSPVKTPGAVPFKWEQAPGKPLNSEPAVDVTASAPQCGQGGSLQLPPRLALRKQLSSPLRERYINMSTSGPLAEFNQKSEAESMKVQLPWIESPASEPPIMKSRSAGDFGSSLQTLSRFGDGAGAQYAQKPAHVHISGDVRPTSPTSILCGPCDGSHPSSLGSEQEARVTGAAFRAPSCASFDSMEQSSVSPESSLTSPLRANTRCNSIDHKRNADIQRSASENAFVKLCRTGKRWMMKSKTHSNLGTIYSPEAWTPARFLDDSEFSDRLDDAKIDHSIVQIIESRLVPSASWVPHEDVGDRSPAYAATLELLSPKLDRVSSKRTSKQKPPRRTKKTSSRLRIRARLRARFLVPMRKALRTLVVRCTFRRRNKNVKAAGPLKPLYHVDYTLTQGEF